MAQTVGMTISAAGFPAPVGAVAEIQRKAGAPLLAEVIGFRDELTLLYPFSDWPASGTATACGWSRDQPLAARRRRAAGPGDRRGGQRRGRQAAAGTERPRRPSTACRRIPARRPRIDQPLATGVRAIDGLLTCGKGQRMGIFAGSGVGKSVLLGMMARYTVGRRDRHRPDRRARPRGQRIHRARPGAGGAGQERGGGGHQQRAGAWCACRRR